MKNSTKIFMTLALMLFGGGLFANHLTGNLLFTARLTGDQEIPLVETDATGVASFFLNETRDTLCITVTVNGLSGPITGAHLHQAPKGMNGDVVYSLTDEVAENSIRTSITGADLTQELIVWMLEGQLYLNVHTDANAPGEIRGQVYLEKDRAFHAMADAAQETMPTESDATGLAYFNLSKTGKEVRYYVVADGLSGPMTGAHLHNAPMGESGDVVVSLTDSIDGNVISGSFDPMDYPGLSEDMAAGNIYLNIHTSAFPAGEIRGQLMEDTGHLVHDLVANTAQEIPAPTGSMANGLGLVDLNYTMDTLFYNIQTEGLTGPISAAHFHAGPAGENGDVLITLTDDVMGNRIVGYATGSALSTENINAFMSGGVYLNVHTDANAPGEIRGQVYKVSREGYTYALEGVQEVPPVTADAYGSGIVSVDRDQRNVHFMMAYNDLTAPQTASHFHNGAVGTNGDVIFPLSDFFAMENTYDAAFGYWTHADDVPFDAGAALAFREGNVYVNIHTAENAGGELRGQVTRNSVCSTVTGLSGTPKAQPLTLFPNPVQDRLTIDLGSATFETLKATVRDLTGKTIDSFTTVGGGEATYDVSELPKGLYFMVISGDRTYRTAKFVRR